MERVVIITKINNSVRVINVVIQSYPVESSSTIGNTTGHGVGVAFIYRWHRASNICVRNACKNNKS